MVHRAFSDKTYLSFGLLSPFKKIMIPKFKKIKQDIYKWNNCYFNLFEKVIIIKTYIFSLLQYTMIFIDSPTDYIKQINTLLFLQFLWTGHDKKKNNEHKISGYVSWSVGVAFSPAQTRKYNNPNHAQDRTQSRSAMGKSIYLLVWSKFTILSCTLCCI